MIPAQYTYLIVNILSIAIPLIASFDKRLNFHREWRYLFPAVFITLAFFILWDILYTHLGIWGFNPRYLTGVTIVNLPLEEWLFFIAIPYACVFTYYSLNYLVKKDLLAKYVKQISVVLILLFLVVALLHINRAYTSVTFLLTAAFLSLHVWVFKTSYLARFYFSYAIILLPFLLVNGILTGSFIEEEVVFYDNTMNLGIRVFTIPIEDSVYGFLLILMNVTLYERFKQKGRDKSAASPL